MKREEFIKAIKEVTEKDFKLRYIKNGKYGKPECWLYPKDNPRQQRMKLNGARVIYRDGTPVMESTPGLLIEEETVKDKEYLKEYLESCFYFIHN